MALPVHTADFNPRSHEGSDNIVDNVDRAVNISIHAPTRGATISVQIVILQFKISIHAPTRGATTHADPPTACHDFNPRSHEGSDINFRQKVLFSLSKNCLKYLILTTNYFN